VLDKLTGSPDIFSAFGARSAAAILLAVCLIAVPATLLFAAELLGGLGSGRARSLVHAGAVGLLAAAIAWQALAEIGLGAGPLRAAAFLASLVLAAWAYLRFEPARSLVAILTLAAPAVLLLFLLRPPVTHFYGSDDSAMPDVASRTPVVIVVFDELPLASLLDERGRIDARTFPGFARLAGGSTWYRRARAVADRTTMAVPAILSGEEPDDSRLPVATDHPRNVFTLLGGSYEETVYESATDICPHRICAPRLSLGAQAAGLLDLVAPEAEPLPGGVFSSFAQWLSDRFPSPPPPEELTRKFIATLRPSADRSLHLLHAELPHVPWHLLPGGETYADPGVPGLEGELWTGSPGLVESGYQRHLLQLQYTDRLLGRILDRMQETRLYDDALLIVLADHGASFIPQFSRRAVNAFTAGWILPVPFFVKRPGQREPRVSAAPVRTIDLVPTVAADLDIEVPWDAPGSAAGSSEPRSNTYQDASGAEIEIPEAGIESELRRAVAYRNDLIPGPDLFAWGGRPGLIGRAEADLPVGAREVVAVFDVPDQFDHVGPPGGDVPALVTGTLHGFPSGPLALLVNGRIAATGRAYREGEAVRFALVARPQAFREGENTLRLYELGPG
jgi:hypothetical protein